jgi:hypothetical protein
MHSASMYPKFPHKRTPSIYPSIHIENTPLGVYILDDVLGGIFIVLRYICTNIDIYNSKYILLHLQLLYIQYMFNYKHISIQIV